MSASVPTEPPENHPVWRWIVPVLLLAVAAIVWKATRPGPSAVVPPPAPAAVTVEPPPQQLLAAIPLLPAETDIGKALQAAIDRIPSAPQDAPAWIALGDVLAQAQRSSGRTIYYDHAEAAYRRALRLDPRRADAMTGLAWVYGGRHHFLGSIEWATRALEVDAGNHTAHGLIGDAALEQGDYERAFDHYQKMMDLRPDLSSWSRGAHLLWLTGRKVEAMALMEQAIRSGGPFAENTAWCRARLALMQFHDGALPTAAQTLAPALKSTPDNTHVLLAAGRVAAAQGDLETAAKYFQKTLAHGANHDALAALGDLCAAKGDPAAAEEYYQQVEALHASSAAEGLHDHTSMAKFYADHDRNLDRALKLAEEHKDTQNVLEADVLAWVRYKNGDLPGAAEAMKKALSQNTPDPEIHFHAGMIAAAAGNRGSAQEHLQMALSMNPRFHPLHAATASRALETLTAQRNPAHPPIAAQTER